MLHINFNINDRRFSRRHIGRYIGSLLLAAAVVAPATVLAGPIPQKGGSELLLARERVARPVAAHQPVALTLFTAPFLQYHAASNSSSHIDLSYSGTNEPLQNINSLIAVENVRTLFFTESKFPLLEFYGGHLRLDAFQNTLHLQNFQPGPSAVRSLHFSGVSLNFHLGHVYSTGRSVHAWRRLSQIVDTALK